MGSIPGMAIQIDLYEQIATLSARMAAAAQDNDWDGLAQLEQHVAALRDTLQATEENNLTSLDVERKRALIQRILADDAEVRRHTEPWMEQVRRFLGAGSTQRRVESAYGAVR